MQLEFQLPLPVTDRIIIEALLLTITIGSSLKPYWDRSGRPPAQQIIADPASHDGPEEEFRLWSVIARIWPKAGHQISVGPSTDFRLNHGSVVRSTTNLLAGYFRTSAMASSAGPFSQASCSSG